MLPMAVRRKGAVPRREDGGEILIDKRNGEVATDQEIRSAILRQTRMLASVYSVEQRVAAVDELLQSGWLARCDGLRLGATARDGYDACVQLLHLH